MLVRPLLCILAVSAVSAMQLRHTDVPKAPVKFRTPLTCVQQAAADADAVELALRKAVANASNVGNGIAVAESMNMLVGSLRQVLGSYLRNDSLYQGVIDDMPVWGQLDTTYKNPTVAQEHFKAMSANFPKLSNLARMASSMHLNDLLQSAANEMKQNTAHDFLRTLRLCASCHDFMRVGPLENVVEDGIPWRDPVDAGYVMCADGLANSGLKGAYSYGIEGRDGWGMDVASMFGVPLYEYDCLDTRPPVPCPGCRVHFFPQCVQGNNEHKAGYGTMTSHMECNGHAAVADGSLLLKIDIEENEWPVFAQESASTLRKFRQINVELHRLGKHAYSPVALQAMQNLLAAGFSVVHLHGSNTQDYVIFGHYRVPLMLEVTLVRSDSGVACPNYAPRHIPEDRPCSIHKPELHNPVLPQ